MSTNIVVCLLLLTFAGLSVSNYLTHTDNIDCQPIPTVVRANDKSSPYFVLLHRCQGSFGTYKPTIKECVKNTTTIVNIKARGKPIFKMENHTSCAGMCIFPEGCTEKFFKRDHNTCICSCKYSPPKRCPPNTSWKEHHCKCTCDLKDNKYKLPKKLDKEQCKFVCPQTCQTGYSMHKDKCFCSRTRTPQQTARKDSSNSNQGKVIALIVIGEFVILYLIFDFVLYFKKAGLAYYIKSKCSRKPQQQEPPQGQPEAKKCLANGSGETNV